MMLKLEKQAARLTNLNARSEKHGEEHVPAADLSFTFDASNDVLSEFDPALKSSLYRKPDANGDQGELLDQPGWMPKLRFPLMSAFKWKTSLDKGSLVVEHGRHRVEFAEIKTADGWSFEPKDGGTVSVTFRVQCYPDEKQIGRLFSMIQEDVELSLWPAKPEVEPAEGWPFPQPGDAQASAEDAALRTAERLGE
jgi:hypothetical protein